MLINETRNYKTIRDTVDQNLQKCTLICHKWSIIRNVLFGILLRSLWWSDFRVFKNGIYCVLGWKYLNRRRWEPEGRYRCSTIFRWEPEGRYHHRLCRANTALLAFNETSLNDINALLTLNWRTECKIMKIEPTRSWRRCSRRGRWGHRGHGRPRSGPSPRSLGRWWRLETRRRSGTQSQWLVSSKRKKEKK